MRQPAVADRFYPGSPTILRQTVTDLLTKAKGKNKIKARALVVPHAGYIYSGAMAAKTFAAVVVPETVILLGPNHNGRGAPVAVSLEPWDMPFGPVGPDREIVDRLLQESAQIKIDETAHRYEHSLEVQVPFLQQLQPKLSLVAITLGHLPYSLCEEVAAALGKIVAESQKELLIVASSDMSHYESRKSCESKDRLALQCIEELDAAELYRTVHQHHISMCGVVPVVIAILAANHCGAKRARLIGYTDSGYVSGDSEQVVGYAGVVIS